MADEQTANLETQPGSSDLDGQMASAWDEVLPSSDEDAPAGESTTEAIGEAPAAEAKASDVDEAGELDNAAKSRLGRKVKEQEDKIARLEGMIGQMLSAAQQPPAATAEPEMPEFITTPQDFEKYQQAKYYHQTKAQQAYANQYHRVLGDIGKAQDSEDVHKEIVGLMMSTVKDGSNTFNRTYGGGAVQDALTNYAAAEAAYWKAKSSGKSPEMGRQEQAVGTAVATSGKAATPSKALPKMDAHTSSLIKGMKEMGVSDADIAAALAG